MLHKIHGELGNKRSDWEDVDEPQKEPPKPYKPYVGYQGAHRRKFDKQSKLINQPPLAENMETSPEYQDKLAMLQKIHAELERTGKIVAPSDDEGPKGYPDPKQMSTHRYAVKSPKTSRVVSNEAPPEDDDEFEQYVQRALGEV
jgi:hypothetical protein